MDKRKEQIRFKLLFLVVAVMGLFVCPRLTQAEDTNAVGFTYDIVYPSSQVGGENGYYNIVAAPGTEQEVILKLNNPGEKAVTVDVTLSGTKTNSNGVIEYGPTKIENDKSLEFPFEKLVSAEKSVELKAGESKEVPIKVKMPETSFEGMILGGIHLKKAETDDDKNEASEGASVKNTYSYIIAMELRNNEASVDPQLEINKAVATQDNYRNAVAINISNVTASLVKDKLDVETQISKKGSKEVLYERKQSKMSMAPNTQMDFYVSMAGDQMKAGDYTARVLATIDGKKWEKDLDFKITKEEADKYNKRDVGLVQDRGLDWKVIIAIVIGFFVLVIILFFIIKAIKNKKIKESQKNSKGKKKKTKKTK